MIHAKNTNIFDQNSSEDNGRTKLDFVVLSSLLIVLVALVPMLLRNHYSSDSYHLLADQHTMWYLQTGRYTFWTFACFFEKLGINLVLSQRWFIAFCLVVLALCIAALAHFFAKISDLKGTHKSLFLVIPLSLMWCNVFLEDWILFPEVAGMIALAAIFLTASIIIFFRNNSIGSLLCSAFLLIIALGAYQSMVGAYIAGIVIISCLKYQDDKKLLLTSSIKGIITGGICAVINIAILKILIANGLFGESGRGSTFAIAAIIQNLLQVIQYQVPFWYNADGLLPFPTMQFLEAALIILFVITFRRSKERGLTYLIAFIIAIGAAYAPHYVEATIILSPRSNISVWLALAFIFAALLCDNFTTHNSQKHITESTNAPHVRKNTKPNLQPLCISGCLLLAFCLLNSAFMWDIAYDTFASNVQDREYATAISNEIHKYENETGSQVRCIGIVNDASPQASYPDTRYVNNQLGTRIMNVGYSRIEMINWIGGLNLQQLDVASEKAQELFGTTNWDSRDLDEQLKFDGDVAYLAIY